MNDGTKGYLLIIGFVIVLTLFWFGFSSSPQPLDSNQIVTESGSGVVNEITETISGTVSQVNALAKAKSYLSYTAFSRSGLIEQLEFEGFSTSDATFGADSVNANWNEQAAKKAKSYLSYSAFSRSSLIDQLVFEGYTSEQAEYGVNSTGL